jgi:flagellum-specific ATP synthase
MDLAQSFCHRLANLPSHVTFGKVESIRGLILRVSGIHHLARLGDRCTVSVGEVKAIEAEVVGFEHTSTVVVPFGDMAGVGPGSSVFLHTAKQSLFPTREWLGRIINGLGEAIDGGPTLPAGQHPYKIRREAPPAHGRQRVGERIDLGVRALNAFVTCCRGQRMGIFAGSGVGKSTLLSMIARQSSADINVIGLIGERGREAREFIEDHLGEEGLSRSIVVVATSDEAAPVRRQAAYTTLAIAEYFRDQGAHVLCLMDSVTRFAMAQREVGLAVGEPPTTKAYTPSVFSELPRLLERAGPGSDGRGDITGIFTVLVDGDDHDEPIADAVRGILDGHIVLDRAIAQRGRFPPINILKSVSRMMPHCNQPHENLAITAARQNIVAYEDMAELIQLGAYQAGSNAAVDEAIRLYPQIEDFLRQGPRDLAPLDGIFDLLAAVVGANDAAAGSRA